jgi:hypothetical protein
MYDLRENPLEKKNIAGQWPQAAGEPRSVFFQKRSAGPDRRRKMMAADQLLIQ